MKKILLNIAIVMLMVGIAVTEGIGQTIFVFPGAKEFGSIVMGNSAPPQLFTITNSGGANLVIRSVLLEGMNPNMFSWTTDTCSSTLPFTLSAGATCTLTARFSPAAGGAKSATLKIISNASNSPAVGVPLTGTGLQPLNVGLVADKTTYNAGDPISVVLTLQNPGGELITSKGFKDKPFDLYLIFTDPDGKVITSQLLQDTNFQDPPPPRATNLEPVERLEAGWVQSLNIPDAHVYYPLSKGGSYSAKAMIPMRTYPDIDYTDTNVDPPVDYSRIDYRNSEGALESNTVNFTLVAAPTVATRIGINPSSSAITAGGSQSYKVTGYDQNNNSLGDVTADTSFSISPDGSCTGNSCTASNIGQHTVTGDDEGTIATANLEVFGTTMVTINAPNIIYGNNGIVTVSVNSSVGTPGGNVALSVDSGSPVSQPLSSGSTTFTLSTPSAGDHALNAMYSPQDYFYGSSGTGKLHVFSYVFSGFFRPVDNPPVFNSVKAGQAIPVKFSLNGNQGMNIFAAGYPTSGTIACSPDAQVEVVEETVTAGASSLSYDPASDQYSYVWKTNKAWSNTCRQLVMRFKDGTEKHANFKFTR